MTNWLDDPEDVTFDEANMREIHFPIDKYVDLPNALMDEAILECGHMSMEECQCHLMDEYWSGTGESMYDDSYIDYLNSGG